MQNHDSIVLQQASEEMNARRK